MLENCANCVLLADRFTALTGRLQDLLNASCGVVLTVGNSHSLLEGAARLKPGLIVLDLGFDEDSTLPLLGKLKADLPDVRIIVLSPYDDPAVAVSALAHGANGVVLKRWIGEDLLLAIDDVSAGGTFLSACFETWPLPAGTLLGQLPGPG